MTILILLPQTMAVFKRRPYPMVDFKAKILGIVIQLCPLLTRTLMDMALATSYRLCQSCIRLCSIIMRSAKYATWRDVPRDALAIPIICFKDCAFNATSIENIETTQARAILLGAEMRVPGPRKGKKHSGKVRRHLPKTESIESLLTDLRRRRSLQTKRKDQESPHDRRQESWKE